MAEDPTRLELIEDALRKRIRLAKVVTYYGTNTGPNYTLDDIIAAAIDANDAYNQIIVDEAKVVVRDART